MNRKIATFALLLLLGSNAFSAESFAVRVALAKDAEGREEFKTYQPAMFAQAGEHLANTIRSCFDTTPTPDTNAFVLIADIGPDGKAQAVEVEPRTNIANCFAAGFAAAEFPIAPTYQNRAGFPVVLEMIIKP